MVVRWVASMEVSIIQSREEISNKEIALPTKEQAIRPWLFDHTVRNLAIHPKPELKSLMMAA